VGSSLFLKQKFGVGYHLDVSFNEAKSQQVEQLQGLFAKHSSRIELEPAVSNTTNHTFVAPADSANLLGSALQELEARKSSLNVDRYRVRMTTLEDVFLALRDKEAPEATDQVALSFETTPLRPSWNHDYPAPAYSPSSWDIYKVALALRLKETVSLNRTQASTLSL
jgi:hypothetical protein